MLIIYIKMSDFIPMGETSDPNRASQHSSRVVETLRRSLSPSTLEIWGDSILVTTAYTKKNIEEAGEEKEIHDRRQGVMKGLEEIRKINVNAVLGYSIACCRALRQV